MYKSNIKGLRKTHPKGIITQTELAREMGVDPSFISKIESGIRTPSFRLMYKLAMYFKCRQCDVFRYIPDGHEK